MAAPAPSVEPTPIRGEFRSSHPRALSDADLLSALRRGDSAIAGPFYDRLRPVIHHTLRRTLRREFPDLEDLVQVTFERILRAIAEDRFLGQSALSTWAAAIAGHVAIDFLRRSVRERRVFDELAPVATPTTNQDRKLEARSEIQRLHEILSRMKPALAEAVLLVDVLGHSVEELAELTLVSVGAAQSRLHRGRQDLVRRAHSLRGST